MANTPNARLNVEDAPEDVRRVDHPEPGDVYRKAGGPGGFWVIIAVTPNGSAYALGFDLEGELKTAQQYSANYFDRNDHRRVGRCQLPQFNVEWF